MTYHCHLRHFLPEVLKPKVSWIIYQKFIIYVRLLAYIIVYAYINQTNQYASTPGFVHMYNTECHA